MGPDINNITDVLTSVLCVFLTCSTAFSIADFEAKGGSAFMFKIVSGYMKLPKVSSK